MYTPWTISKIKLGGGVKHNYSKVYSLARNFTVYIVFFRSQLHQQQCLHAIATLKNGKMGFPRQEFHGLYSVFVLMTFPRNMISTRQILNNFFQFFFSFPEKIFMNWERWGWGWGWCSEAGEWGWWSQQRQTYPTMSCTWEVISKISCTLHVFLARRRRKSFQPIQWNSVCGNT